MTRIKMHISNVKLPFYPPCEVKYGLQNKVSTNIQYLKNKLNNKNKLDFTVLLIPRLQFPLTKYKSLATQGHDENSKEKIREEGRERNVSNFDFSSPFYMLIPPFLSLENLLKIF